MYDPMGETLFVGRQPERAEIKTSLGAGERVLLLYGQPMVGKTRLALQVAEDVCDENTAAGIQRPTVYTADCKAAENWSDVIKALCSAFSFDETLTEEALLDAIGRRFGVAGKPARKVKPDTGSGERKKGEGVETSVMLLLLKLNKLHPRQTERLTHFLMALVKYDVTTLLTSRRRLRVTRVKEVKAMTDADVHLLLSQEAPDVNLSDFVDVLKYCRGLPPSVIQMAQLVGGDPEMALTAEELKQQLEKNPGMLMKDLEPEAEGFFSVLSSEVRSHVTKLVQLLDGTFSVKALRVALGVEDGSAKVVIRSLCEESTVVLEPASDPSAGTESRRLQVDPFILHHVRNMGHVATDDQARLRVVTFVGRVLTTAERELYLADQDTVHGYLHGDWPVLQHVLRQAIHCTDNVYPAYLKVALEAEKLLVKCFPEEATEFFRKMAVVSVRFGTPRDQAALQGLIGSALTQSAAMTEWGEAMDCFKRALPRLREADKKSLNLPRLLCYIGSAYFRQSKFEESETYLKEALEACRLVDADDERVNFQLIQIRSLLSLPYIFKGQVSTAKELILETLALCDSQPYTHHPHKPVLLNSLGLCFERSGESQEQALNFYLSSLAERRRYMKSNSRDLVPPLNNIGMQYCKRGNHDRALKHLEEAASIMGNTKHFSTGLTQQHLAQVCMQSGDFERAERHLVMADRVYSDITPHHDVRAKVALFRAHIFITSQCFDVTKVRELLRQTCEICQSKKDTLGDVTLLVLTSAIEHLLQMDGWRVTNPWTGDILAWTLKLLKNYAGDKSERMENHQSILEEALTLGSGVTEDQKEALTLHVIKGCQQCTALEGSDDARELWEKVERETEGHRKTREILQDSDIMQNIMQSKDEGRDKVTQQVTEDVNPLLPAAVGIVYSNGGCEQKEVKQSDLSKEDKAEEGPGMAYAAVREDEKQGDSKDEKEEFSQRAKVIRPTSAAVDPLTDVRGPTATYVGPMAFCALETSGTPGTPAAHEAQTTQGRHVPTESHVSPATHVIPETPVEHEARATHETQVAGERLSIQETHAPSETTAVFPEGHVHQNSGSYQRVIRQAPTEATSEQQRHQQQEHEKLHHLYQQQQQQHNHQQQRQQNIAEAAEISPSQSVAFRTNGQSLSEPPEAASPSFERNSQEESYESVPNPTIFKHHNLATLLSQFGEEANVTPQFPESYGSPQASGASFSIGNISGGIFTNCFNTQPILHVTINSVHGTVELAPSYRMPKPVSAGHRAHCDRREPEDVDTQQGSGDSDGLWAFGTMGHSQQSCGRSSPDAELRFGGSDAAIGIQEESLLEHDSEPQENAEIEESEKTRERTAQTAKRAPVEEENHEPIAEQVHASVGVHGHAPITQERAPIEEQVHVPATDEQHASIEEQTSNLKEDSPIAVYTHPQKNRNNVP